MSFFQDAASELVYPVLPIFLTTTLGAPVATVGLIEGMAEATSSVMKGVSGRAADRRRRKPMVAAGYALAALAKGIIAVAAVWPVVLLGRFVDRVGKGIRTSPRDALIVDDTDPGNRGRAFGFHRAADTAGAVVGPLLGLALYAALDHQIRPLLMAAVVPAVVSAALVWFVRERAAVASGVERPVAGATATDAEVSIPAVAPEATRPYRRLVAVLGLFGLVNFTDALLLLRLRELGAGLTGVVGAYVLYNVAYAVLSYPAGVVSDQRSRRAVFGAGLAVFAVAYIGLALATTVATATALLALYGGFTALTDGVGKAWIADLAPPGQVGAALGRFYLVTGMTSLVAGVWAGLAWGSDGRTPLLVSGCVTAVLAVGMLSPLARTLDPARRG